MRGITSATLAIGAGLVSLASALTPITIKGNAFFQGNSRFYIRGVDYQPGAFIVSLHFHPTTVLISF